MSLPPTKPGWVRLGLSNITRSDFRMPESQPSPAYSTPRRPSRPTVPAESSMDCSDSWPSPSPISPGRTSLIASMRFARASGKTCERKPTAKKASARIGKSDRNAK